MPKLSRHDILSLNRANPHQRAFGKALFPPLALSIVTAVNTEVNPTVTLRHQPGNLVLDYPNSPILLASRTSHDRLDIHLVFDNGNPRSRATMFTWSVTDDPANGLVITGFDAGVEAPQAANVAQPMVFTLRPEIAAGLSLSAPSGCPELVSDIAWAVQGCLSGEHFR